MKLSGKFLSTVMVVVAAIGLSVPPPTTASSLGLDSAAVGQSLPPQAPPTNQIIIKYRSGSRAQAARAQAGQMQSLSAKAGMALTFVRDMSGDANVLSLPQKLPLEQVRLISERLMELPDVEYAEPDERAFPGLVPNDTYYGNQWDLFGPQGINVQPAWDVTTGSAGIVMAVIDTGITNHADLSGRTVPGYDFVSDADPGNDGQNNGVNDRDSDPSDPGDWITQAEHDSGYFAGLGCLVTNSTWHGTHVAGTMGAIGNNAAGIAGINWNSKILPVRVLGKCGGIVSDIADGMRWAAGLPVPGVSSNPSPAKVLNLSLWGSGSCSPIYQSAINDVTSAGASVVTIAGNGNDLASLHEPGNCTGVITVAATGAGGSRATYSSYGSMVEISAPGDNILSTLNTGTTVPVADTYDSYWGTSMAAPHVAGVVSLMLSKNPALSPAQVLSIIQSSARAFPAGSTCNTSNCGSGILDAAAAVNAVHVFADVPVPGKEWMEPWIIAFKNAGVTTGCAPGLYCPESPVTRAEMAVFLLRAIHGGSYVPPAPTHDFADVPVTGKEWMEPWIEQFYAEGLTAGCGGGNYCPENKVTRAEMAVFVLRALHGGSYVPPAGSGVFADVPVAGKEWMEPWIIAFYNAGITTGCSVSPLRYCPENNVTRAEMAVFIDRAYSLYP